MTKIICYSLFCRTSFLCADVKKRSKRNHLPSPQFCSKSLAIIEFYIVQSFLKSANCTFIYGGPATAIFSLMILVK